MKKITHPKPVKTTHPDLGELQIDNPEVNEFENWDEAHRHCGGEENSLKAFNSWYRTASMNLGRSSLRQAKKDVDLEKLYKDVRAAISTYVPDTREAGLSGAAAKAKIDELKTALKSGVELTREELLALLGEAA
jgi:hypothetical protein